MRNWPGLSCASSPWMRGSARSWRCRPSTWSLDRPMYFSQSWPLSLLAFFLAPSLSASFLAGLSSGISTGEVELGLGLGPMLALMVLAVEGAAGAFGLADGG